MSDVSLEVAIAQHADWFVPWLRKFSGTLLRRERVGHTLQATALANEVIVKLLSSARPIESLDDRLLRSLASSAVRHVLVDHARRRRRLKRGAQAQRVAIDLDELSHGRDSDDRLLAIHEALTEFELVHPEEAELVRHRYFGGMTVDEAGALLDWSPRTTARRWNFAKAWLRERCAPACDG